ncbi:hypothetical protein CVT25_001703 [Psilocybe cyanescens]|uniref:Uncharacterized protein n=1 Tax=Psilocybe cyanescens TaxID=93625 RepID=A0A409XHI2_PSICY|nr:hypothetical protein CVT25_001703 [Psilocybe cyanescens]
MTSPIAPPAPNPTPSRATLDFVFTSTIPPISRPTWLESTHISKPPVPPIALRIHARRVLDASGLGQPDAALDIR